MKIVDYFLMRFISSEIWNIGIEFHKGNRWINESHINLIIFTKMQFDKIFLAPDGEKNGINIVQRWFIWYIIMGVQLPR